MSTASRTHQSPYTVFTGPTQTFEGRLAKRVNIETNKINVQAGSSFDYTIDIYEYGVLLGFTVAVNDELMGIDCSMYGDDNSEDVVNNRTMLEVSYLGRGLTTDELHAVSPSGTSLDIGGRPHSIRPYLARGKNTFTGMEKEYSKIAGTADDKWIVLEYAPVIRESYNRLYFNIRNTNTGGNRLIHHMFISRIRYVDVNPVIQRGTTSSANNEAVLDFSIPTPVSPPSAGSRVKYEQ